MFRVEITIKKIILFLQVFISFSILAESTEILLSTSTGSVYGTLLTPDNIDLYSIILIISGSGPTDRNGNSPGIINNHLKYLAEGLLKQNIASLRFDKRGIGQSINAEKNESLLTFEKYVDDVVKWSNKLKQDKRFNKLIILGHSEGALIGMLASQIVNPDALILVSASCNPADIILKNQLKPKLSENSYKTSVEIINTLKSGNLFSNPPKELNILFRESVQPYLISWFKYNPLKEIKKLNMPVLIIHGTKDIQIPYTDSEILHQNNSNSKLEIIKDMNHILKTVKEKDIEQTKYYIDSNIPINKKIILSITSFIKSLE